MIPVDPITLLNMTESEMLDFKSGQYKFYGKASDEEKSDLLKDIITFANTFKTGDAFIVIGVAEAGGRKDSVVGVAKPLEDNDVQQFVNSKTNKPVKFLVYTAKADGKDINIIQIAQTQQRPIVVTKAFGTLKPADVYIRSGSSTTTATPEQIAQMALADHQISAAQVRIHLEWAADDGQTKLGNEARIECTKLIMPPERPKPPKPPRPFDPTEKMWRALAAAGYPGYAETEADTDDDLPSGGYADYIMACAMLAPLRIFIQNLGVKNVESVNLKITIPKGDGVKVIGEGDLPEKPRAVLQLSATFSQRSIPYDTFVRETQDAWIVEVDARKIQPQDEFWSSNIYISVDKDQLITAHARIFADDLAQPIEIPLTIKATVITREMNAADAELFDPDEDD